MKGKDRLVTAERSPSSRATPFARWSAMHLAVVSLLLVTMGCQERTRSHAGDASSAGTPAVSFRDVSEEAGIRFRHVNGATGRKWMPETMGSGVAFLDYNGDGWLDLLLVNGMPLERGSREALGVRPGALGAGRSVLRPPAQGLTPAASSPTMALYRNRRDGTFADVTRKVGLDRPLYGMGAAVADYDGDGDADLGVTHLDGVALFRNERGRRFTEVRATGIAPGGWATSAAWLDYDRDGWLDLFVCRYVRWSPETDLFVTLDGTHKTYARPTQYPGDSCRLYRNLGPGARWRFEDVTRASGIWHPRGKALGVALCDYDADGALDVVVANDTEQNLLYHNQGNAAFKEVGTAMGVAVSELGVAKAGMGIDTADILNDGREAILVTNFSGEQITLYHRDRYGLFLDVSASSGLGPASVRYLGFGAFFFDYDLDGWQDVFVANGHIQEDAGVRNPEVAHAQPALLFHNERGGRFRDVTAGSGAALRHPVVGRGAAYGDYDNDGDPDVAVSANAGPARLLRNENVTGNHWLRVELAGRGGHRDAIGARVRVRAASLPPEGASLLVRSGSSYLSAHDRRLLFGLGRATRAEAVEIRWPDGSVQSTGPVAADRTLRIVQGR